MKTNVIIFGFSGAGKSTAADLVGKKLGLRVVHPSSILRDLLEGRRPRADRSTAGTGFWEGASGVSLFTSRLRDAKPADMRADKILLKELKKGSVVMDSWTMPWLSPDGIKVYLKASFDERARRVAKRSRISLAESRRIVRMKDEETRKLNVRLYGFDMKKDHGVFDLVISTENLTADQVARLIVARAGQ